MTLQTNDFTPRPVDAATRDALWPLADDTMGRVVIRSTEGKRAVRSDEWVRLTDDLSGRDVEVRRADCGIGCRCAAEVRLAGPDALQVALERLPEVAAGDSNDAEIDALTDALDLALALLGRSRS